MDKVIINYYRYLLKENFPNAGELDQANIFVEAIGGKLINCGNTGNYMQLFMNVVANRITNIKYRCSCEPVANVAVEILCNVMKGKTLEEVAGLSEETFFQLLGTCDEALGRKVKGLLELIAEGINNYQNPTGQNEVGSKDGDIESTSHNWDGVLS